MHKVKENFLVQAVVLAVGGIVCKIIGAVYRIPLTNALGAEGIGLYQMVYAVYSLFIVLSCGGLTSAVSRLVAEDRANGLSGRRHVKVGFILSLIAAFIAATFLMAMNFEIGKLQGNADCSAGYLIIAPGIIFVSVSSVMKGYFQGRLNMVPTTVSNLIEQIIKLGLGLGLAFYLVKQNIRYALYGTLLAVTASEFVAILFLSISYLVVRSKERKSMHGNSLRNDVKYQKGEIKKFLGVVVPFTFLSIVLPLSSLIDSFLIVNLLKTNASAAEATAMYGIYSGQVTTLINMPIMILLSLAASIVPSMSKEREQRNLDGILLKTRLSVKLCLLIGIPVMILFMFFNYEIMALLYPRLGEAAIKTGASLIVVMAPSIIAMSLAEIFGAILSALDKVYDSALSMLIGVVIKTVIIVTLTSTLGIMAAAIGSLMLSVTALIINSTLIIKQIGYRKEMIRGVGIITFGSALIALISLLNKIIFVNIYLQLILSVVLGGIIYFFIITAFDVFTMDETQSLPMSGFLIKTRNRLRFWDGEV
ncbi:MAG: oligosaccharide flippase family protein [Christensenellales bacterium]